MRHRILIVSLVGVLLTGCHKHSMSLPIAGASATVAAKDFTSVYFVGAGQSNMEHEDLRYVFPFQTNVAVGGTHIDQWQKGGVLYGNMLNACKHGPEARPCVILFWQGEADSGDVATASLWSGKFLSMVDSLRADLGYTVPVVYVQIGQVNNPAWTGWAEVQRQQALTQGMRPKMTMISAADMFPDSGDGLHYGQDQYKIIQQRLLAAWYTL